MKSFLLASVAVALLSLSACGGGGSIGTPPPAQTFTISGTLAGLAAGTSVVLQNNGGNSLTVSANGPFTFSTAINSGSPYNVTVSPQPTGQTCAVTNGSGTATTNVTGVQVNCTTAPTFLIGGTVSGVTAAGLVLQDNGGDNLTILANGPFTFHTPASTYNVTILSQPAGETCTVASGSGTATAPVTDVSVTCAVGASTFTIGGTVSGVTAVGLVLQNNGGDDLTIGATGDFTFHTPVSSGATYNVTVLSQPTGETCTVTNGSGTASANVTNVTVACAAGTATFTIGGTVSGVTASGLVLQDNGGDDLSIGANGGFTFHTAVNSGSAYSVTVSSQPTGETCTVTSGSGTATADVTNVQVTCTTSSSNTFTIGGTASGVTAGGLVLENNGGDDLSIGANGSFTFHTAVSAGATYNVTILSQPNGETCTLTNASGTANANVTNVTVTCAATVNVTISVVVAGLTASNTGLVIEDNGINPLSISGNGTFPITVAAGTPYAITVSTQPTGATCTVTNGSGTANANVTVNVNCVPTITTFTIGGTVSGLIGTVVLQNNSGDNLSVSSSGGFTFATPINSGTTYNVTVLTQPSTETCTVTNGSGTATANVTNVSVSCSSITFTISGTVSGLSGTVVLQNNGGNNLTVTANGGFTFTTAINSGSAYDVTVKTQPSGQTCTVTGGSGTAGGNVTNVSVACAASTFTLSVTTTGLTGTLVLQDDLSDSLTFTSNKTQTFATSYASGSTYSVTIQTQPSGQTCTLSGNASGTITANTTVTATCAASGSLKVNIAVTGLSGTVTMQNDQGDTLTFTSNTTQAFSGTYTSGSTYAVYVTGQPSAQSCIPTYSTGTITAAVTINAICATGSTRKLGTISGVKSVACFGGIKNGVCQQMTVSCPSLPDVFAYVKTNAPSGTANGTVTYGTGTDGNGLYESIFTFGSTAVQNVLNAGFTTVQISWGTPFNTNQDSGWVQGPGGVLATACRYATVTQWIYDNIHNDDKTAPYCATANSGGSGALAYALSQYDSGNILSMAEVTSGPPTGRLDWGCGCTQGQKNVQCGNSSSMGTCFGTADAPVWDPAYDPNAPSGSGLCSTAVKGTLPPGGLNFFLGDSVEAPGAAYNLSKTHVNLVFGDADSSSAIPIGQDWFDNITTTKTQACVPMGQHSLANTLAGAQQIANDLIGMCALQ